MKRIENKKNQKIWIPAGCFLMSAIILLAASRKVPGFAEWYGQMIYPFFVHTIGSVMGWFPFSIAEFGFYASVVWAVYTFIQGVHRPMQAVQSVCLYLSVLLFLYAAFCGVNYYRTPFSYYYMKQKNDGEAAEQTEDREETLKAMCLWLTEKVNTARAELEFDGDAYKHMEKKGVSAMNRLAEEYPALAGYYPKAKPVMVSEILSVQQCSGVYSPFTVEANYNRDMVSYNIPHTICHEMSHLRGFMREDEANFIGYLACLESEDADYRYSGYLLGWIYAGNALAKVDYDAYSKNYSMLSEDVLNDLDANHTFWEQYEGTAAEIQETVNDAYLKANGQSGGVHTYGQVVDLMLLDFRYRR